MNKTRVAALIPARGGSKGIVNKNLVLFGGHPLIHWSIKLAKECPLIDEVFVSSDSPEILDFSLINGAVSLERPALISTDTSTPRDYLKFHSDLLSKYQYLLLLQPTSPLRNGSDVESALSLLEASSGIKSRCVVSFGPARTSPKNMFTLVNGEMRPFFTSTTDVNRQSIAQCFEINGAIFACEFSELQDRDYVFRAMEVIPLFMPKLRSIDIDDLEDLRMAELVFDKLNSTRRKGKR